MEIVCGCKQAGNPLDVYILAGQSNALGIAQIVPDMPEPFEDVLVYSEGGASEDNPKAYKNIVPASKGLGWTMLHYGPEVGMGQVLSKLGRKIAVIKCAWAGTGIYDFWNPGNNGRPEGIGYTLFLEAVKNGMERFRAEGYVPEIQGIAWMQGESDADKTEEIAKQYSQNLKNFFDTVKEKLQLGDIRIVIGEIYPITVPFNGKILMPYKNIVVGEQKKFAKKYPNTKFLDTENIPINRADPYHWYGEEALELGRKFGELLLAK